LNKLNKEIKFKKEVPGDYAVAGKGKRFTSN
jgi:hypothetical protein